MDDNYQYYIMQYGYMRINPHISFYFFVCSLVTMNRNPQNFNYIS